MPTKISADREPNGNGKDRNGRANGSVEASAQRRRVKLPAWLDHFNKHDLKILLRCWVAIWVASLLMFIGPALRSIGIATFFGALLLYIVPPSSILIIYLLAALSLLFGMCLAWAWGLITMKAALAARPASQTMARLLQLQEEAVSQAKQTGQNPLTIAEELIHNGFMFDARVTVVFYVLSCVFVYVMARLRVVNQKFVLAEIFGIIIMDLFLLFGPTLPSWNWEVAKVLVEPGAIGIALGFACNLLLFPQSTSYAILSQMEKIVLMGQFPFQCTRDGLAEKPIDLTQMKSSKAKLIESFKAMKPMMAFLPLDISRGRWGVEDIRSLLDPVRQMMLAQIALLDFHIARQRAHDKISMTKSGPGDETDDAGTESKSYASGVGNRQPRDGLDMMHALQAPEMGEIRSNTTQALNKSSADLLQVSSEAINLVAECIRLVNTRRWFRRHPAEEFDQAASRGEEILGRLRSEKKICASESTEGLIESHKDLFDENGNLKSEELQGPYDLRALVLGMVAEERILGAATATENLLARILELFNGHQSPPLSGLPMGTGDDPKTLDDQVKEAHHQLRAAGIGSPIQERLQDFFYREKGIWGTITAQIAVVIYMADFTFSVVSRTAGTILGGVMGMVAWYIGSGSGTGNAYGLSAITAAMTLILVWWRLFLPPALLPCAVMSGATYVLVIGFSYDDTHIQQYGLPGYGYAAFYKRLVTVLLGLVAAFVVQIFPKPPSASRHVRKTLFNTIRNLSDHYALLLSHWGRADDPSPVSIVAEKISLDLAETLLALQGSINLLKFEITLGPFDQGTFLQIQELCQDMNQCLGRLLALTGSLPVELQHRLTQNVGIMDDTIIDSVMAVLGVINQSLKTGDPLPERLPAPLLTRCYVAWHAEHRKAEFSTALVRNEDYRRYCVAVSSYLKFLSTVDDILLVLKGVLGESPIVNSWREERSPV
ncbi:uncharacterized protein N7477_001363 [Penicillium maclennaniae]|uniref:uncharacterized protein n=1 Tax=Penicillium maclennaniae TaxID=1343394 RepID=UPI0025415D3E|nr:uncharacterized protein N7477_001363 [Penicillium maclennaniae]KAJ5681423.1 hypothetical protein N7477_001363 [Penicillium maclennaniae]